MSVLGRVCTCHTVPHKKHCEMFRPWQHIKELEAENKRLRAEKNHLKKAIEEHHKKTRDHEMCWENDVELWEAAGLDAVRPEPPPWEEFMVRCARYRASREIKLPPQDLTYKVLMERSEQIKKGEGSED